MNKPFKSIELSTVIVYGRAMIKMMISRDLMSRKFFERAGRFLHIELDYDQEMDRIMQEILSSKGYTDAVDFDREIEKMSDEEFSHFLSDVLEVWELWSRFYIPKGSSTHRRMDWR